MRYTVETVGDVVVAKIHGDMWGKPEDSPLKDELQTRASGADQRFVLDFSGASALNSTGIGIVVSSVTGIQRAGGKVRVCGMNQRVRATFEITGIAGILSIFDTLDAALGARWPEN